LSYYDNKGKNMTTKEVATETGVAEQTVLKYAKILKIDHLGTGMRKIYNWKKADIDRLKKSIGKRGRPPKKERN
jgi:predicted transcriptional regulator